MMSSWILSTFGLLRLLGGTEQSALLSDGVKAIEKNCSDCYGRSRAELQEGIDKVERYLAEDGPEKARAYGALSDGYGVKLFFFTPHETLEEKSLWELRYQIAKKWIAADPTDPEPWTRIAHLMVPKAEKISALRQALALDDHRYDAHASLGTNLASVGDFDEGIVHLKIAFEHEPILRTRRIFGQRLIEVARDAGKPELEADIQRKLDSLPKE